MTCMDCMEFLFFLRYMCHTLCFFVVTLWYIYIYMIHLCDTWCSYRIGYVSPFEREWLRFLEGTVPHILR